MPFDGSGIVCKKQQAAKLTEDQPLPPCASSWRGSGPELQGTALHLRRYPESLLHQSRAETHTIRWFVGRNAEAPVTSKGRSWKRKTTYLHYLVLGVDELHLWDTDAHWVARLLCLQSRHKTKL